MAPLAFTKSRWRRSTITTIPAPPAPRAGFSAKSGEAARRSPSARIFHCASQTACSAGVGTPCAASAAFVACLSSTTR